MLQLIPTNPTKKTQSDTPDLSNSQILAGTPFQKNSFFTVGFKANPEDNADRKSKVKGFLVDFQTQLQKLHEKESSLSLRDKIKEHSEPLHAILESIFCLFNVNVQLIHQDQSDSALRVEPVMHTGRAIQCLTYIAIVLNRFPYSFLKIIDLNKFTICKHVQLKKEGHTDLFNARILTNAMFMTDVHDTYEKVEAHFYKVVLHHVLKKMPSIHTDWPIDSSPKLSPQREASKRFLTMSPGLNKEKSSPTLSKRSMSPSTHERAEKSKQKVPVDEIKVKERTEIFYKMLTNPRYVYEVSDPRLQIKATFLKEKLEFLDPVGVSKDWWESLLERDVTVIEKPHGEFSLKF